MLKVLLKLMSSSSLFTSLLVVSCRFEMWSISLIEPGLFLTSDSETLPTKTQSELLKTCNLLFGTLEAPFLWQHLADVYERLIWPSSIRPALSPSLSLSQLCDLVHLVLSTVPLVCSFNPLKLTVLLFHASYYCSMVYTAIDKLYIPPILSQIHTY